jgi:hypothetical protein
MVSQGRNFRGKKYLVTMQFVKYIDIYSIENLAFYELLRLPGWKPVASSNQRQKQPGEPHNQ